MAMVQDCGLQPGDDEAGVILDARYRMVGKSNEAIRTKLNLPKSFAWSSQMHRNVLQLMGDSGPPSLHSLSTKSHGQSF
jgi:hypothetical protein